MSSSNETIFALSSGPVPAGLAVVRISGEEVPAVVTALVGDVPPARQAALRSIRTRNGLVIDTGLILFFPAPHSFTGENVAELHLHGGRAVVDALHRELAQFRNLRAAAPGEFSRRAFENGKLDLIEAEGLADLIAAETEMQRRLAVEQSSGGLSSIYYGWSDRLTRARALIEAELDFPDEEDVPGSVSDQVWADVASLVNELKNHLEQLEAGEIIRDGFKVVIAGRPNAGKSSLMNALAMRDVAIVTDIAGTTRDVLHVDLSMDGYLVRLYDTAGLRETDEIVEREGIRRAEKIIAEADLVIFIEDVSIESGAEELADDAVLVGTKSDLPRQSARAYDLLISTTHATGLDALRALIVERLKTKVHPQSMAIPSRARHKETLTQALAALRTSLHDSHRGLDLRAEDLRVASDALGRVTGRVDVENLLDVIFGEFCIGK
ncbi:MULTISPECIES: tRNA uridine-5-carboxymethylaminomethyl(34) synthesis GTPase MnmE [unclassified Rhizobium]|jgi:tRNA modification GTPase|uniref:tRNA uridine-5-carboxymethylaminomethyl(34) synthesis GTPase MnmE n=1 Tax=unclassified Rhizobium TaxID=2613769 RepID=UPI000DE52CA3|nr:MULTISPECIES: tRNA uridine-5-carboxymethylaminomethyl(34) synthesis GTPase MnmE [unclassified Rhizobium]MBD9450590.1 tRNA uridine-5-carboxymethylaminomethyl(34) synthesis GTPase MnmE [Rhizobium sp. RHZ02]NMN71254.1 tRNA modification GTPase [Rhizobium sp. 57MFTsu3.2]